MWAAFAAADIRQGARGSSRPLSPMVRTSLREILEHEIAHLRGLDLKGADLSSPDCRSGSLNPMCRSVEPCQAHVLHPQFVNRCFGGIHGCHPVWGFPARTDAGNGVCGLGAADGSRGLHARRATSVYRRRVSLMQRRDSKRRPRQGLPAQEQGAA